MMMLMQGCRSCIESERQGLLELKTYLTWVTTDPHLDILREWRSSDHSCCSWRRVKCNVTSKRVIGLSLGSLDDSHSPDTLPLLNLTLFYPFEELQSLNLSRSNFQGWFDERQGFYISFHSFFFQFLFLQCKKGSLLFLQVIRVWEVSGILRLWILVSAFTIALSCHS